MLAHKSVCKGQRILADVGRQVPSRGFSSKPSLSQACLRTLRPAHSLSAQRPAWQQIYRTTQSPSRTSRPSQARFLSTETGPYNTPLPPADTFSPSTSFNDLSASVNDTLLNAVTSSNTTWYSGYLKELGLDFGYGPSSTLQYLFEHLHMADGLSIGGSILTTAIVIRLLTFPLVIAASHTSAKLTALREITEPIQKRLNESSRTQDQMALQLARQDLRKVYQNADINLWKSFLPMLQIPVGFAFWRLLRNMADVPVPGMEVGGFWWFPDLVYPDPYFILPLATGFLQHMTLRLGGEAGMSVATTKLRNAMMYGLPLLAIVFTSFAPAAVQISFTAAAGLSLCTTTLLRQPAFRKMLSLAPRVTPAKVDTAAAAAAAASPYKGTINVAGRARPATTTTARTTSTTTTTEGAKRRFSITNPIRDAWKSATDYVGEVMPQAKARAGAAGDKAGKRKSDAYEEKRRKEIEKERWRWEDAQKAAREGGRRR